MIFKAITRFCRNFIHEVADKGSTTQPQFPAGLTWLEAQSEFIAALDELSESSTRIKSLATDPQGYIQRLTDPPSKPAATLRATVEAARKIRAEMKLLAAAANRVGDACVAVDRETTIILADIHPETPALSSN